MRKTCLFVWASWLICLPCIGADADSKATKDSSSKNAITAYQVGWRCPAALEIGCGSHAKPILLQLENNTGVSEAWLNRQGTVVAVVWKPGVKRQERQAAEKLLKQEKASKLSRGAQNNALKDFGTAKGWYRCTEVDRLSEEEAVVIAARWVRRLQVKIRVSPDKADGLRDALTEGLKACLTGKAPMPSSDEKAALKLRRVAGPFLNDDQLKILAEAAGCGMRALPDEE